MWNPFRVRPQAARGLPTDATLGCDVPPRGGEERWPDIPPGSWLMAADTHSAVAVEEVPIGSRSLAIPSCAKVYRQAAKPASRYHSATHSGECSYWTTALSSSAMGRLRLSTVTQIILETVPAVSSNLSVASRGTNDPGSISWSWRAASVQEEHSG